MGALKLRPEVAAFAQLMEKKLRDNDHKPGWFYDGTDALVDRLLEEAEELKSVTETSGAWCSAPPSRISADDKTKIGREAADVANFAMMIADVCGALHSMVAPAPAECSKCGGRGWVGADGAAMPCNGLAHVAPATPPVGDLQAFACAKCPRWFSTLGDLEAHQRSCIGDLPVAGETDSSLGGAPDRKSGVPSGPAPAAVANPRETTSAAGVGSRQGVGDLPQGAREAARPICDGTFFHGGKTWYCGNLAGHEGGHTGRDSDPRNATPAAAQGALRDNQKHETPAADNIRRARALATPGERARAHALLTALGFSCVDTTCGWNGQPHQRNCDAAHEALSAVENEGKAAMLELAKVSAAALRDAGVAATPAAQRIPAREVPTGDRVLPVKLDPFVRALADRWWDYGEGDDHWGVLTGALSEMLAIEADRRGEP